MSTETREMLLEQLKGTRRHLDEIWESVSLTMEEREERELPEEPYELLDELPLEIMWEMGEPFAVVLGTGGPHIEIRGGTRHDGSAYSLHGYWGGEHVTISGESITRTGEYFRELVEEG